MDQTLLNAVLSGSIHLDFSTLVLVYLLLDKEIEPQPLFDLSKCSESYCLENFRFAKSDIPDLKAALRIPDVLRCSKHVKFNGLEGELCI